MRLNEKYQAVNTEIVVSERSSSTREQALTQAIAIANEYIHDPVIFSANTNNMKNNARVHVNPDDTTETLERRLIDEQTKERTWGSRA